MKTTLPEGWFRLTRGETVHYFPRNEVKPLCGMIDRYTGLDGDVAVVESVNEEARCLHCRAQLGDYNKKCWDDMDKAGAMATRAQGRSRLEMLREAHSLMVFDAGMSFYCQVCGNRQQSLQPSKTFDHRVECPGGVIQAEVLLITGDWD